MTTFQDSRITESSGLAASRRYPSVLWTQNDENKKPHVYGVNSTTGKTVATFSLRNALITDPEAISVDHLDRFWYIDCGDNDENRPYIRAFVLGEPVPTKNHGDLPCTGYRLVYPGGARNAESFFVNPTNGYRYIITKQATSALYRLPTTLRTDRNNTLVAVASSMGAFVSDAAITPDGRFLLTRRKDENTTVYVHQTSDWSLIDSITVTSQTKPEGITVAHDQLSFWISSEGVHAPFYKVSMPTAYRKAVTPATPPPPVPATPCG
jgi:hypothetical protein